MNKNKSDHCFPPDPYRETNAQNALQRVETHDKRPDPEDIEVENIEEDMHAKYFRKAETHGDVIYRQAAIDAILDLHDCPNGFSDTYDKACIIGVLEKLPSAIVPIKDKCLTCIHCENCTDEQTFEEFMFGQDMGNPEDGSL